MLLEYWPDSMAGRYSVLWSKCWYLLLFILGFIALGLFQGFKDNINEELNDPYANSIPVSARFVPNLDTTQLRADYPGFRFDRIQEVGYSEVRVGDGKLVYLNGYSIPKGHPYESVIAQQIVHQAKDSGIFLSKKGYKKLFEALPVADSIPSIFFKNLGIHQVNAHLNVARVCETLPANVDLIVPLQYYNQIIDASLYKDTVITDPNNIWEIMLSEVGQDEEILYSWSDSLSGFARERFQKRVFAVPKDPEDDPGIVTINFRDQLTYEEVSQFIDAFHQQLMATNSSDFPNASINLEKQRVKVGSWVPPTEWNLFTITVGGIDRTEVFAVRDALESSFPKLNLDMKGFNMIKMLGDLEARIDFFQILVLTMLVTLSIVVNYQTLNHHLYKRRQNIGYLKTVGVDQEIFYYQYLISSLMESLLFSLVAVCIAYGAMFFFSKAVFSFSINENTVGFVLVMVFTNVALYLLVIRQYLRKSFRQLIAN